jgi:integrase
MRTQAEALAHARETGQRVETKFGENLRERVSATGKFTYYWTPRLPDPEKPGKTKTVWIKLAASNRVEAKACAKVGISEEVKGAFAPKPTDTWTDLKTKFFEGQWQRTQFVDGSVEPDTVRLAEGDYRVHLAHFEQFGKASDITREAVDAWWLEKRMRLKSSSLKRIRNLARRIYAPPFAHLEVPKAPRKRKPVAPRPEEFYPFLAEIHDEDMRFVGTLIAFTGMRVSEARGLAKHNVFLDEDKLVVAQQWTRSGLKDATKTPAGEDRVIPLVPFLKEELRLRFEQVDGEFFCADQTGEVFPDHQIRYAINKAGRAVGREHTTTHHLRAWFNTTLRAARVDGYVIKAILGHEGDEDMTDLYTHPYAEEEMIRVVLEACATFGFGQITESVLA